ncbi:alpha/beta fold hydrolase [Streptomyces yunnanensis]|nr:alpha/beta fold hydrolase [Streptomyces yunnanensis]
MPLPRKPLAPVRTASATYSSFSKVADHGFRGIAHDRRGHGRSAQPWGGYDFDTFADDLNDLITALDLRGITLVAHSMGGGELARYIGRHGTTRMNKAVLLSAIPPLMIKTDGTPQGVPAEVFETIRTGQRAGVEGAVESRGAVMSGLLGELWPTRRRSTLFEYIDGFYNSRRIQERLGFLKPDRVRGEVPRRPGGSRTNAPEHPSTHSDQLISTSRATREAHPAAAPDTGHECRVRRRRVCGSPSRRRLTTVTAGATGSPGPLPGDPSAFRAWPLP